MFNFKMCKNRLSVLNKSKNQKCFIKVYIKTKDLVC